MFPIFFPEEDGVIALDDANFRASLTAYESILIKFYAPWCGHCKALAPEWSKAAQKLRKANSSITLAKLDGTKFTDATRTYKINGYPTIMLFRGGEPSDYTGGRTESEIIAWVNKKAGSSFHLLNTTEQVEQFQRKYASFVLGVYSTLHTPHAVGFKKMADMFEEDNAVLAITTSAEVRQHLGITTDSVVVLKSFDEQRNDLLADGSFDLSEMRQFIVASSTPLVQELTQEKAKQIFKSSHLKKHVLVFVDPHDPHHAPIIAAVRATAEAFKGQTLTLTVASTEKRVLDFFGVSSSQFPAVFMADQSNPGGMKKYAFTETGSDSSSRTGHTLLSDADALRAFVKAALAGEIKVHLKSEEVAPEDTTGGVAIIKGVSFGPLVLDNDRDVFVAFYAPWCGHCKKLAPVWEQLGAKYKKTDQIVIAKMDSTLNEIDVPNVVVKGFPSLYFFPGNNKGKPVKYDGKRTLESMAAYVKLMATNAVNHEEL
jgi:protein disulfide-isomerase A1